MKIRDITNEDDYRHEHEQENGKDHERAGEPRPSEARRTEARRPDARPAEGRPAETLRRGNVRVSIWANPTPWGDVRWNVSFARVYSRRDGDGYSRSFEFNDLLDLIQGAFDARRWIAKVEKRVNRRRWILF